MRLQHDLLLHFTDKDVEVPVIELRFQNPSAHSLHAAVLFPFPGIIQEGSCWGRGKAQKSPGRPWTHYVAKDGLGLLILPLSISKVLRLQSWATKSCLVLGFFFSPFLNLLRSTSHTIKLSILKCTTWHYCL